MTQLETKIKSEVSSLDPEYVATICGSYRRGAKSSGDIDILLTHPEFKAVDGKKVRITFITFRDIIYKYQFSQQIHNKSIFGIGSDLISAKRILFVCIPVSAFIQA